MSRGLYLSALWLLGGLITGCGEDLTAPGKGAIEQLYVQNAESYLTDEFAVEDRPKGWFGSLIRQVLG